MITYNPENLIKSDFRPVGEPSADMPGLGAMRRVAIRENVTIASVTAFRHDGGLWQIYLRPNPESGFVDMPMVRGIAKPEKDSVRDAAPDMLTALRRANQHIEQLAQMLNAVRPGKVRASDFTEETRAAIAKAEGRA